VPAPQRTARIEDEIWNPAQAKAHAEGASLGALMRAAVERYASGELTSQALPASQPAPELTSQPQPASQANGSVTSQGTAALVTAIGAGEPSTGVVCMGPGCWQRDTRMYGLRKLPLCTACAAVLEGRTYQREIPPGAARIMQGGSAA
jgi:anti-sigma factor RsiW